MLGKCTQIKKQIDKTNASFKKKMGTRLGSGCGS